MTPFPDLVAALKAAELFIRENWTKLPDKVRETIENFDGPGVSPVQRVVKLTEAFYAYHKKTGTGLNTIAGRTLIGQLAGFANENGFSVNPVNRWPGIIGAMRRELDELGTHPAADEDPEPLAEMLPPPEPQAVPPPPAE